VIPAQKPVNAAFQEEAFMLVLTRKLGERLVLADSIVVTVVQVRSGKVRLGIEAPAYLSVEREELRTRRSLAPQRPSVARTR
jgi:carbon storage regulator